MMLAGRVAVNGEQASVLGITVDPDEDLVEVDGRPVSLAPPRWLAVHKPVGVITTADDPQGRETVFDLVGPRAKGLRYVGRLDLLTEGLILLTNEGEALHRLTHPSGEVEREYLVVLDGSRPGTEVTPDIPRRLVEGVKLDDGPAAATRAAWASDRPPELRLVLTEGRNREVRRMIAAVGFDVARLRRIRYGPIGLGELEPGAWRELGEDEVARIHEAVGLAG